MRSSLLAALVSLTMFANLEAADSSSWLFLSLLEEKQIVTFERDPESGELTRRLETDCPAEPACMGVSPDRRTLFVSFRSTGELARLSDQSVNRETHRRQSRRRW